MKSSWMDWSWDWTKRYLMTAGAIWMVSALVGPEIGRNWIIISAGVAAALSLLVLRPKKTV